MLDYWRNKKRNITLGFEPQDGCFYFQADGNIYHVTLEDIKLLHNSSNFILDVY